MSENCITVFGGNRLWRLNKANIESGVAAFNKGEVVGVLVSQGGGYDFSNLECLGRFEGLRYLVIVDAKNIGLGYIEGLVSLEYLSIGEVNSSVCLDALINLRSLRVSLGGGIALPKNGLERLADLAIWGLRDCDLTALKNYRNIRSLELIQAKKIISLKGIESCPFLTCLTIAYCPVLTDIDSLLMVPELQLLDFKNVKKISDFSVVSNLVCLKKLIFDNVSVFKNINFIGSLKRLEHLVIMGAKIEDGNILPLGDLPALSYVFLDKKLRLEPVYSNLVKVVDKNGKAGFVG